jgi:hypothetical protein
MKVHSYRNFYRKEKKKSKSHEAILLWDKNNRLAFDNGLAILVGADGFKRNDWFVFAYVCQKWRELSWCRQERPPAPLFQRLTQIYRTWKFIPQHSRNQRRTRAFCARVV